MPNAIKYNTSTETLALKKGNFWIGTGDVGKGPTNVTGQYNGITPPAGGFTIYLNKETQGPSIYTVSTEAQLVSLTNTIGAQSFTTLEECLNWFATQTDKMVFNADYPAIVTNGLVLNLDAGFTPSYPTTGTTWYDVSSGGNNGTLTNGPTWTSNDGGGVIQFDGTNDYILLNSSINIAHNNAWSTSVWVYLDTYNESPFGYYNDSSTPGWYYFRRDIESATSNTRVRLYIREQRDTGWSWNSLYPFGSTYRTPATTDGYWLNQWLNVVMTKSTARDYKVYINGVYKTGNSRSAAYLNNGLSVNAIGVSYGSLFFNGNIGPFSIYNKELTASEVLQNYNAQKSRFGL